MIYTYIKKVICLLLVVVLFLSGCTVKNRYTTAELSEEIFTLTTFSELKQLSGASLSTYFVFGDGDVKRFNVNVSATGESADTLACFEVNNAEQRSTAITGISNYLTNLSTAFKSTMEQEYKKVENRLLVEIDNIIILVICNDTAPVWNYLNDLSAKEVV
jgi:hypothetical protein